MQLLGIDIVGTLTGVKTQNQVIERLIHILDIDHIPLVNVTVRLMVNLSFEPQLRTVMVQFIIWLSHMLNRTAGG